MLAVVNGAVIEGVFGHPVRLEVTVRQGLPAFSLLGMPDQTLRESRDRVRAAIASSGLAFPKANVTVSLTPAGLPKNGSMLDLPIAIGILAAAKSLPTDGPDDWSQLGFIGELGLDGSVRGVPGMVSLADAVVGRELVVPFDGANEAAVVRPGQVRAVGSLLEVVEWLSGVGLRPSIVEPSQPCLPSLDAADLADVRGQALARYALEVAAAGGHHLLMIGPPGGGKTMLASRLAGLLPPLEREDAIIVTKVQSVCGIGVPLEGLVRTPPFRAPHRGISEVGLVGGGGANLIRPGEISKAHGGVLFLDEFGEFPRGVLDAMRTPLETGVINLSRVGVSATLPCRFQLVAAMNPCPCGLGGGDDGRCRCSELAIERYRSKISSPLLDRFDLLITVDPPDPLTLLDLGEPEEPSSIVRARVVAARELAAERGLRCNADMPPEMLNRYAPLSSGARSLLRSALESGQLTARGLSRVRTVARTIADLAGGPLELTEASVATALGLRVHVHQSDVRAA